MTNEHGLEIIDDKDSLTIDELRALKKMARYYSAGQIVLSMIIGIGASAMALYEAWDFIHAVIMKGK